MAHDEFGNFYDEKNFLARAIWWVLGIALVIRLVFWWFAPTRPLTHIDAVMVGMEALCTKNYPIKANLNSMIYHLPGNAYYGRTNENVQCYDNETDANKDGFRNIY